MSKINDILLSLRIKEMLDNQHFGSLMIKQDLTEENSWCSSFATNGVEWFYNPNFVKNYKGRVNLGFMYHSMLHLALGNIIALEGYDKDIWDIAADIEVWNTAYSLNLGDIPKNIVNLCSAYQDMNAKEIYDLLISDGTHKSFDQLKEIRLDEHLDNTTKDHEPLDLSYLDDENSSYEENKEECENGDDCGGEGKEDGKSKNASKGEDSESSDENSGESTESENSGEGEEGDEGEESSDGEGGEAEGGEGQKSTSGKPSGKPSKGSSTEGNDSSKDSNQDSGDNSGEPSPSDSQDSSDQSDNSSDDSSNPSSSDSESSEGNLETDKEVKPTISKPTLSEEDIKGIEIEFLDQLSNIPMHGNGGPGNMRRLIKNRKEPKLDWKEILRNTMVTSFNKDDYSFKKPSKRSYCLGEMKYILPSQGEGKTIDIGVSIDSSGSITTDIFDEFIAEIRSIVENYEDYKLHIWHVDTQVYNPQIFTPDNIHLLDDYEFVGGGGNDFEQNYHYLKDNDIVPELLVILSDGEPCGSWGWDDYCETIFVVRNPYNHIEAPYGVTVQMIPHDGPPRKDHHGCSSTPKD